MISVTIDDNQAILDLMKYIMNKIDPEGSHFFSGLFEFFRDFICFHSLSL